MASVITLAFENWKAQEAASGKAVLLDEFVFANVPNLDPTQPIDRNEKLPPANQIVHRQAVNKAGLASENAVAYSVTMGADVGNFDFNWIGLLNQASGTVAMITHAPTQKKLKNQNGQQGNVLTRSFILEFQGAAEETQIKTSAETWQIDFTARLSGIDEMQRLINVDSYGAAAFFNDGFEVTRSGEQYTVKKGLGYVGGLRGELAQNQILNGLRNTKIYADFSYQGNIVSQWNTVVKIISAATLNNYVDTAGFTHQVFAIASIDASGNVKDLRPMGALSSQEISALETRFKLDLSKKFDKANISGQKGNDNDKVPSLNLFTTEIGKLASTGYSYSKIESDNRFQQKDAPSLRLVGVNSTNKIILFPPQADSDEAYFQYNNGTSWSGRVKIPITADVSTLYSSGNTTKDDNGFVRTGKKTALITENVVQSTGKSEFDVMSQKAVTDALESKFNKSGGFLDGGISVKNDVIAQYLRLLDSTSTRRINLVPPNADSTEAYFQYNEGTSWFGRLIIPMTTGITTLYSSGNTTTDSSGFVRTGSKTALITDNVVQAVGTSTSNVMSQKAVTDALLGVNQNWVDVKSQRSANTDYTNSTGKPIFVSIGKEGGGNAGALYINGVRVGSMTGGDPAMTISAIVPAGGVYKYTSTNIAIWVELR